MFDWKFGPNFLCDGTGGDGGTGGTGGTEHPVSAPWAAAQGVWKIGEAGKEQPWYASIQEPEIRSLMETKAYANPGELAMAYSNLNKMQNGSPNVVNVPGKDAKPEDWDAFYGKLGRPATSDLYDFKLPADAQLDAATVTFGKTLMHSLGVPADKAPAVAEMWQKFVGEQNAAVADAEAKANEQALTALQTKWGADLEVNKAAGMRVMQALGLDADQMGRIESAIGAAPIVELLAMIGRKSDEGGFKINSNNQQNPNDPATMTKEQAEARMNALRADAAFMAKYSDAKHPQHKEAVDEMLALQMRA